MNHHRFKQALLVFSVLLCCTSPASGYFSLTTSPSIIEPPKEIAQVKTMVDEIGDFAVKTMERELRHSHPSLSSLTLSKILYDEAIISEALYYNFVLSNNSLSSASVTPNGNQPHHLPPNIPYQMEFLDLLKPRAVWLGLPSESLIEEGENQHQKRLEEEEEGGERDGERKGERKGGKLSLSPLESFQSNLLLSDLQLPGPLDLFINTNTKTDHNKRQTVRFKLPNELELGMKEIKKISIDENCNIILRNVESVQLLSPLQLTLKKMKNNITTTTTTTTMEEFERLLEEGEGEEEGEKVMVEWKERPKLLLGGRKIQIISTKKLKVKQRGEHFVEIFDPAATGGGEKEKEEKGKGKGRKEANKLEFSQTNNFLRSLFSILQEKKMAMPMQGGHKAEVNLEEGKVEAVFYFLLPMVLEVEEVKGESKGASSFASSKSLARHQRSKQTGSWKAFVLMSSDGSKKLVRYEKLEVTEQPSVTFETSLLINGSLPQYLPSFLKSQPLSLPNN